MKILLTNDDGIEAEGIDALRRALLEVDDVEVAVIAPDGNRSATARMITIHRPLTVREHRFDDGTIGYKTDGSPVDCVRLGSLGLVEGFKADVVVAGINHGANLGDDITYSGTVAAAFEGIMLGLPAIAVSQQSDAHELDFRRSTSFAFEQAARFAAGVVDRLDEVPLPEGTLLNVNCPAGEVLGVEVARLGKRHYRDELTVESRGRDHTVYRIYGDEPGWRREEGTDLNAVAEGRIAVTPIHFDLTDHPGVETLRAYDLAQLIGPAARNVE